MKSIIETLFTIEQDYIKSIIGEFKVTRKYFLGIKYYEKQEWL